MNNHTPNTVGIDISKAYLDAYELPSRRFAQAMGQQAKTDAVDAQVLAAMGAAMPLRQTRPRSPTRRDLDELHSARDALVKDRTAALNRQKHARHKLLKRQLKNRLAQVRRQLKALDEEIAKRIADDERLSRQSEVLMSIPGIASVTAAGLLSVMPELGRIDAKAVASLAGLAPVTRESGQWKGRSFIRGGRARPRRILYMAAVSASRQPGSGSQVRRAARAWQAAKGRPDRHHAQTAGAGQRAAEPGSTVDAQSHRHVRLKPRPGTPTTFA